MWKFHGSARNSVARGKLWALIISLYSIVRTGLVLHTQLFTGQILFLMPNQQCQSTEGNQNELQQ